LTASDPGIHFGRASRLKTLPPFSPAACRLVQLMSDESANFREVSQVLRMDAALSSQVLRVANSALLGCRYEIASILQALFVLGADRLRDIAVTVAIKNYMGHGDDSFLHRAWRHNLATALWCETLAEHCGIDRPTAYTAGMLHDIGRLALLKLFPREYSAFMDQAITGDLDILEDERKLCDADHCQIGESLAQSWKFPPVLQDVIGNHHCEVTRESPRPRLLVQAACIAASVSGFQAVGSEPAWDSSRIDRLLPPGSSAKRLDYQEMLDAVALKLNQTECSLL
jgi:putative nucleotidyltransferase with HDIG domain